MLNKGLEKENYDKHLNLFISYGLKKMNDFFEENESIDRTLRFENNLSRVLARILMEDGNVYRKFQKDFLSIIDEDGNIEKVFFQKSNDYIRNYYFDNKKIKHFKAVTLTGISKCESEFYDNNTGKCIPDIVLEVNDKLIFMEVKRTNVDASCQVIYQIENYSGSKYCDDVKKIFWNDITTILLNLNSRDIVIKDYIEYLKTFFPEWFVYKMNYVIKDADYKYDEFDIDSVSDSVNVRLFNLFLRFYKDTGKVSYRHLRTRRALSVDSEFSNELQIRFNKDNNNIGVHLWTGETLGNMRNFEKYISKHYDKFIEFKKYNDFNGVTCSIKPYILFRDAYKYLYDEKLINFSDDIITGEFISLFTGKRCFNDFCNVIKDNISLIEKYIPNILDILNMLNDLYYQEGRTVIIVSVGYELIINYPYKYYSKLEEKTNFSLGIDGLDEIVTSSLKMYNNFFGIKLKSGDDNG